MALLCRILVQRFYIGDRCLARRLIDARRTLFPGEGNQGRHRGLVAAVGAEIGDLRPAADVENGVAGAGGEDELLQDAAESQRILKARIVADRLLNGMRDLAHLSASPEKPLGLSIGIAVHTPGRGETVRELTDRADAAMYDAKKSGKGHYALAPVFQSSSSDVSAAEPAP